MRVFLFANVHWLWRFLYFVHGFTIFDWKTFCVVLLLGVFQTLIAWDGGILAVKGFEPCGARHLTQWICLGASALIRTASAFNSET